MFQEPTKDRSEPSEDVIERGSRQPETAEGFDHSNSITAAGIPPGRYGVQLKAQTLFPPPTDAASLMVGARFPYRNNNRLPN